MEGMIVRDFRVLQHEYLKQIGSRRSSNKWAQELVIKLLKCMHGQWLYRNVVVYDNKHGTECVMHKEQLREEIQKQLDLGGDGLSYEDQYLLDINLGNLDDSNGRKQEYWLRAIAAARIAKQLREEQRQRQEEGIG